MQEKDQEDGKNHTSIYQSKSSVSTFTKYLIHTSDEKEKIVKMRLRETNVEEMKECPVRLDLKQQHLTAVVVCRCTSPTGDLQRGCQMALFLHLLLHLNTSSLARGVNETPVHRLWRLQSS